MVVVVDGSDVHRQRMDLCARRCLVSRLHIFLFAEAEEFFRFVGFLMGFKLGDSVIQFGGTFNVSLDGEALVLALSGRCNLMATVRVACIGRASVLLLPIGHLGAR